MVSLLPGTEVEITSFILPVFFCRMSLPSPPQPGSNNPRSERIRRSSRRMELLIDGNCVMHKYHHQLPFCTYSELLDGVESKHCQVLRDKLGQSSELCSVDSEELMLLTMEALRDVNRTERSQVWGTIYRNILARKTPSPPNSEDDELQDIKVKYKTITHFSLVLSFAFQRYYDNSIGYLNRHVVPRSNHHWIGSGHTIGVCVPKFACQPNTSVPSGPIIILSRHFKKLLSQQDNFGMAAVM